MASFIKNPYKVNISLDGSHQIASMVSLFDLLFVDDGQFLSFRSDVKEGISLSHDLLVYCSSIYTANGDINLTATTQEQWLRYGMDLTPVKFDKRSKGKFVENSSFKTDPIAGKRGYWIYDKEAALYPQGFPDFHETNGLGDSQNPKPWYSPVLSTSDFDQTPELTVGLANELSESSVLVISNRDTVFEQVLSSELLSAYKHVWLNIDNMMTWKIVAYCLNLDVDYNSEDFNYTTVSNFIKNNPDILKSHYVWIRSSFFGDYVWGEDYNQTLNQGSTVHHKNLYIGSQDTKKYDALNYNILVDKATNNSNRSENTLPYIPRTAPIVDLVTESIVGEISGQSPSDVAKRLIELSEESDKSQIGSLLPAITRKSANSNQDLSSSLADHLSPPGWFDSETRLDPSKYTDFPVVYPKDGNIVQDGRLINISLDELWIYLKRLVYGRESDEISTSTDSDLGYIAAVNDSATISDTKPLRARQDSFLDGGNKTRKGDVLEYSYNTQDLNDVKLRVSKFVSNPTVTKISTFDLLETLSAEVVGEKTDRGIQNFKVPNIAEDGSYIEGEVIDESKPIGSGLFSSRAVPFSLKELELFMKINRYNILKTNIFLKENYTILGGLGRTAYTEDIQNKAAGGLYQLHKDFNYEVDDPNTVPDCSVVEFNPKTPKANSVLLRDNENDYGSSEELKDSSREFSSAEVYLAADGTWRSVHEHARVPVLTTVEEPY